MRALLLLNRNAGTADRAVPLLEACAARGVRAVECASKADARAAVRGVVEGGDDLDLVISAGGDGTLRGVVNELAPCLERVRVGIVPLGTGNDLARTLGVPADPVEALVLALSGAERRIDLARATAGGRATLFANVASGGFGGEVERAVDDDVKDRWGPLAYVRGAAATAADLPRYAVEARFDGGPPERFEALHLTVANGRTVGGGYEVAPGADPADGLLDIVVVEPGGPIALAGIAARLLAGDYTKSEGVRPRRARTVEVAARPAMRWSLDGSLFTDDPIRFEMLPRALRVAAR